MENTPQRNDDLPKQIRVLGRLPQQGLDEQTVLKQCDLGGQDSLARYDQIQTAAKPGTLVDPICVKVLELILSRYNPNGIDPEMFRGTRQKEKDAIAMTAALFGKNYEDFDTQSAGFLLSGGTESINQAEWMYRNKFFADKGIELRRIGLAKAVYQLAEQYGDKGRIPTPRVLLPVNVHFSEKRAADVFGLGIDSLEFYGLDRNFDIDLADLEKVVEDIYRQGDEIIMHYAAGGDVTRGKVHNVAEANRVIRETITRVTRRESKTPPTIIDAAGSYLFIGAMHDNPKYDGKMPEISFNIEGVRGIVADPHKQPMPYSCGMLMLKDWEDICHTDLRAIMNLNYLDVDKDKLLEASSVFATLPTSRSGANAFAVWAYMAHKGLDGIRASKEKIWELVKDFRDYITESGDYELVCEPQTQVVPFRLRVDGLDPEKEGELNMAVYKAVKHSPDHYHHISNDEEMLVRSRSDFWKVETTGTNQYTGLFTTIMEHNTQEGMDSLKRLLDEEAHRIKSRL